MTDKPRPWWKQVPPGTPQTATDSALEAAHEVAAEGVPARDPAVSGGPNDLADGETREVKGSGQKPYVLKNTGGVYSCTCPAWMHQGVAIERRTCKHLRALRGQANEDTRVAEATARAGATVPGSTRTASTASGTAPPLLLAHTWENDVDLTGWWMSEKLDGVRAYWDGTQLVSRLGNTFVAPDWFIEGLPKDMPLDGELFGGRKRFQRTVSTVRRQDRSEAWREISFLVFDAPRHGGTFEERIRAIETLLANRSLAHVKAHEHAICTGTTHLRDELARVESLGGEGLMMRSPGSRYEVGRSHTLLKVKTFRDAEARVTAHLPGAGKHKGRLGALQCELPDGTLFSVGTGLSDEERNAPPPVGSIITFRYQELSNDGVPRFPSYVGVRTDLPWPPPDTTTGARPASSGALTSPPIQPSATVGTNSPAPTSSAQTTSVASPRAASPVPAHGSDGNSSTTPPSQTSSPSTRTSNATRDARVFHRDGVTWEITLSGRSHVVRRARGEAVETVTTSFSGGAAAWRNANELVTARVAEGFTEIDDEGVQDGV